MPEAITLHVQEPSVAADVSLAYRALLQLLEPPPLFEIPTHVFRISVIFAKLGISK